jgi:hypothetical protein
VTGPDQPQVPGGATRASGGATRASGGATQVHGETGVGPDETSTGGGQTPGSAADDATTAGDGASGRAAHAPNPWLAMFAAACLTVLVMGVLFPNLWYGIHEGSDIAVPYSYALRIAQGEPPYTRTFEVEYPPLAMALFRIPGHTGTEESYQTWFSLLMGVITVATGAVTAFAACRLWPRGGRAYVASVLFPVGVALIGAIVINRYDIAVALLVAIFILCLGAGWYTAAGFVIGMGFALKITPAALLPLVLLLAGRPRRWVWPLVAFGAAALAPFLPYLLKSTSGVWYTFQYHLGRPLQIESVLGTPQLLGQLLGADWATWGWSHQAHSLIAPGVGVAADLSGGLTLLAVAAVYLVAFSRRRHLRVSPADQVIVVLALLLALMTFSKVLSPQYFVWILPAWTLVAARDRWIAVLGGVTLVLTQIEFPSLFGSSLLLMEPAGLSVVITRNILLLVLFSFSLWRVWRPPAQAELLPAAPAFRRGEPTG